MANIVVRSVDQGADSGGGWGSQGPGISEVEPPGFTDSLDGAGVREGTRDKTLSFGCATRTVLPSNTREMAERRAGWEADEELSFE